LRSRPYRNEVLAGATGTTVKHTSPSRIKAYRFCLPPIEEQHAIARVLRSIDAKIDLNKRMNETLEAVAGAMFKSWFVEFGPVRAKAEGRRPLGMDAETAVLFPNSFVNSPIGKIPKGWSCISLDQIATFLNGLALQNFASDGSNSLPAIKIAQLRRGNADGADQVSSNIPSEYVIRDGEILFSWSGSLEVVVWCGGSGALNQHLFKVSSMRYPKWFHYGWILEHLPNFRHIAAGKATTMGHIQRHHLSEAKVVIPPEQVILKADKIMGPLLQKRISNDLESRTLTSIRETILPKLISGELPVTDVEQMVEAKP